MTTDIMALRGPCAPLDPAAAADRDAACQLCRLYALAIDLWDEPMLRSVFAPTALVCGALGEAAVDEYLPKLLASVRAYAVTMHMIMNQYVVIEGDTGTVWSYAVAHHVGQPGGGAENVVVGVHYRDRVERVPLGWWIIRREVVRQWIQSS